MIRLSLLLRTWHLAGVQSWWAGYGACKVPVKPLAPLAPLRAPASHRRLAQLDPVARIL